MRYEGTRPSGKDKDIEVYKFVMGRDEARAVRDIVFMAKMQTPITMETASFRNRLANIVRGFDEALRK